MSGQGGELKEKEFTVHDCGHPQWTEGCPRCWEEVVAIAKGEAQVASVEVQSIGGTFLAWHVIYLMASWKAQLEPSLRSLDLQKVAVAKTIAVNIENMISHLLGLIQNPAAMDAAIAAAAKAQVEVAARLKAEDEAAAKAKEQGPVETASGLIITG